MSQKDSIKEAIEKELEFKRGLEKLSSSPVKSSDYVSPLEGNVMKVKSSSPAPQDSVKRIKSGTEHINTTSKMPQLSGDDFTKKINALRGLSKKVAGVIPLAGAGYAALSGDPAMAAEELAGDVPVVGQAYEALKSDSAGQSPEEEKMMLGEIQARKNYDASPAAKDARMAALKKIRGF